MGTIRRAILILIFLLPLAGFCQSQCDSRNGNSIPAHGKFRILNILINIVYDQTPERDPYYGVTNTDWRPGNPDKLNDNLPAYLNKFLSVDYKGTKPEGLMSRLFYESSLGHFILLGDFMVVNVRQSEITPQKAGANFDFTEVIKTAVAKINQLGGVKTVYGHDKLSDYDYFEKGGAGAPKKMGPNGKIDFIMIFTRNSVRHEENGKVIYNYGQHNPMEGNSWETQLCVPCTLLMEGKPVVNELSTAQNIGGYDISIKDKNIAFHEFAHDLFGGNNFHTSGGNHFGTSNAAVFTGLQGGYGLMGAANSSLIGCNGYERWRMGWIDTLSNPALYDISANGMNGEVSVANGKQSFVLRDFVTTGDALRIQLPYVDSAAENQYLWLENHQVGRNNSLDYFQYSKENDCRPAGTPGIYAYIQVGRDKLSSSKSREIYSTDETDNLRMLTAKGNWDYRIDTYYDTTTCIAWKAVRPCEILYRENSLCGYNDMQTHCWDSTGRAAKITQTSVCEYPWIISKNGTKHNDLPFMGDEMTAFSGRSRIDMSSNPAAVNVITFYTMEFNRQFAAYKKVNNRHIYLSGLSVSMQDKPDGTVAVDIRWDQYDVTGNVRWTGPIILKEKALLKNRASLLLDQNETPLQLTRDQATGYFSPSTTMECDSGSVLEIGQKCKLTLDDKSRLIVKKGATLRLLPGAQVRVLNASSVVIEAGAIFEDRGAKIVLKRGGVFQKP
jgi:hypothetical protein